MLKFVGGKFHCTYPLNFPQSYLSYSFSLCWINGTYGIPIDEPLNNVNYEKDMIKYYPFIALHLFVCTAMILIPGIIYRCMSKKSGINLDLILRQIQQSERESITANAEQYSKKLAIKMMILANVASNMNFYRKKVKCVIFLWIWISNVAN